MAVRSPEGPQRLYEEAMPMAACLLPEAAMLWEMALSSSQA